jgi:hypothetical protein
LDSPLTNIQIHAGKQYVNNYANDTRYVSPMSNYPIKKVHKYINENPIYENNNMMQNKKRPE